MVHWTVKCQTMSALMKRDIVTISKTTSKTARVSSMYIVLQSECAFHVFQALFMYTTTKLTDIYHPKQHNRSTEWMRIFKRFQLICHEYFLGIPNVSDSPLLTFLASGPGNYGYITLLVQCLSKEILCRWLEYNLVMLPTSRPKTVSLLFSSAGDKVQKMQNNIASRLHHEMGSELVITYRKGHGICSQGHAECGITKMIRMSLYVGVCTSLTVVNRRFRFGAGGECSNPNWAKSRHWQKLRLPSPVRYDTPYPYIGISRIGMKIYPILIVEFSSCLRSLSFVRQPKMALN